MEYINIQKILSDSKFLKELDQAIDSGKSIEWDYNGEDYVGVDVFETDTAKKSVIELLNKYFVNKKAT